METRSVLIIISVLLFSPLPARAYSDDSTHPALTEEIVALYNEHHPEGTLSRSHARALIGGSIDEDRDFRFMRHFYDPSTQLGLSTLASINNGNPWPSARTWLHRQEGVEREYTWEAAIDLYKKGDTTEALRLVGHILHLFEDMTVPDHVRDDPHPPILSLGSPYESWTKQFGPGLLGITSKLVASRVRPISMSNIDAALHATAQFTQEHFFSKDTIGGRHATPSIDFRFTELVRNGEYITFGYHYIPGVPPMPVVRVVKGFNFKDGSLYDRYILTDPENIILRGYWEHLSQSAVLRGAGVLELFFREVGRGDAAYPPAVSLTRPPPRLEPMPQAILAPVPADPFIVPISVTGMAATYIPILGDVHFDNGITSPQPTSNIDSRVPHPQNIFPGIVTISVPPLDPQVPIPAGQLIEPLPVRLQLDAPQ